MNRRLRSALIHGALFLVTFITTTMAGALWSFGRSIIIADENGDAMYNHQYGWEDFSLGLPYSITFLLILTVHEFGHYFTAVFYKIKTSLPYYIPLPPLLFSIGTLGAVIRIKSRMHSNVQNFDVGIAGPLAGFVVAVLLLFYGFLTLPDADYVIREHHPEFAQFGANYADHAYTREQLGEAPDVIIGNNLLFWFFENYVADPALVPNHHELMHFPVLFAAFLSLFVTALNLLPVGQLDGGHVLYGLIGYRRHRIVASAIFCLFLFYATLGMLPPGASLDVFGMITAPHIPAIGLMVGLLFFCLKALRTPTMTTLMVAVAMFTVQYAIAFFFPTVVGYPGWLLFAVIIGRLMPVAHPPTEIEVPLTRGRKILGWIALIVFIICWTPDPIRIIVP